MQNRCTHMDLLCSNGPKHENEASKHPCLHICFMVSVHRACNNSGTFMSETSSISAVKSGFLPDTEYTLSSLVRFTIYFYPNTPTNCCVTEKPNNKYRNLEQAYLIPEVMMVQAPKMPYRCNILLFPPRFSFLKMSSGLSVLKASSRANIGRAVIQTPAFRAATA